MNIPVAGLILVPLSLTILFFLPAYLVEWVIFVSIFQAAAVVNIKGGFTIGLARFYFVGLLIAARLIPQWLAGRLWFLHDEPVARSARILAIFVFWSVLSAFLLPVLFEGLMVDVPRAGVDNLFYFQLPLHWSPSNAGQAGYLIIEFITVLYLVQGSSQTGYLERIAKTLTEAGLFVVGIGTYQILCPRLGLRFPDWIFNSNATWAQNFKQSVGGVSRVSATFVEPSVAGGFLAAWSAFELTQALYGGEQNWLHWVCAILGSIMLVETASSTGYVMAALVWVAIAWNSLKPILIHGRIRVRLCVAVLVMAAAALLTLATMPNVQLLLSQLLFEKSRSASGLHRSVTFGRAVRVFYETLGLGAGLGSNRAMSLFFYVLSNVGLPGTLLLLYLLWESYSQMSQRLSNRTGDPALRKFIAAIGYAFSVNLVALVVSGAEITAPQLWVLWGMLLAGLRHGWLVESGVLDLKEAHACFEPPADVRDVAPLGALGAMPTR